MFYGFTKLVLHPASGASGGHIFRCTTKDMEERRAKGAAAPVGSPGVMLTGFDESVPDVFALVPRPNFNQGWCREANTLGVRWRLSPPLRAYCGAVENRRQYRDLGSAVRMSPVEAVLAIDLSIAKRRQTPTARHRTGLNRVNCTNANTYRVSTSPLRSPVSKQVSKGWL